MRLFALSPVLLGACAAVAVASRTLEDLAKNEIRASAEWRTAHLLLAFFTESDKFASITPVSSTRVAGFAKQTADAQLKKYVFEKVVATRHRNSLVHPDCTADTQDGKTAQKIMRELNEDLRRNRLKLFWAAAIASPDDALINKIDDLVNANAVMDEELISDTVYDVCPLHCGRTTEEIMREVDETYLQKQADLRAPQDNAASDKALIANLLSELRGVRPGDRTAALRVSQNLLQEIDNATAGQKDLKMLNEIFEMKLSECEEAFDMRLLSRYLDLEDPGSEMLYQSLQAMRAMLAVVQSDFEAARSKVQALNGLRWPRSY